MLLKRTAEGLALGALLPALGGTAGAAGRVDQSNRGRQSPPPARAQPGYPDIADVSHADPAIAAFFAAKSTKDVARTMAHFSPDLLAYADATTRFYNPSFDSMKSAFARIMPNWGAGLSYLMRIIGGPESALVEFTDTPELFGKDIRILASVDLREGLIVRWIDHWDSGGWDDAAFAKSENPPVRFPASLREQEVGRNASSKLQAIVQRLHHRLAGGDAPGVAELLSYDVIVEDMAMNARVVGRPSAQDYLSRTSRTAPWGWSSRLRHTFGGDLGGAYEWLAGEAGQATIGITALELDAAGRISRLTSTYDGRTLEPSMRTKLAALSVGTWPRTSARSPS